MQQTTQICPKCGQRNSSLNTKCLACDADLATSVRRPAAAPAAPAFTVQKTVRPAAGASARTSLRPKGAGAPADGIDATIRLSVAPPSEVTEEIRRVGHFRLLNVLGAGGMGEVFRAYDEKLDRLVALKVIRREEFTRLDDTERNEEQRRFVDEAQLSGRLDHPNICPIYELDEDEEGTAFFAMKLVEGRTLAVLWDEAGEERLMPEKLGGFLQIFLKICDALSFAHDRGIIHRDVKPVNVMVGDFGEVYVMDWGAALLKELGHRRNAPKTRLEVHREKSSFGSVVGTLRYMAPEQALGRRHEVDEKSDVFSVGATLYHLLAGHAPYTSNDVHELLGQAQKAQFVAPDLVAGGGQVPPMLSEVVVKAMAAKPEERYASVLDLKKAIEGFIHGSYQRPQRKFSSGSKIVVQGEEGETAYIIDKGRCAVIKEKGNERVVVRELGPGEVFGETAVFLKTVRTATVEAVDETTVTVVTRDAMIRGLGLNSWLGDFVTALADRFTEVDQQLREIQISSQG